MSDSTEQNFSGSLPISTQIEKWPQTSAEQSSTKLRSGFMNPIAIGGIVLGIALITANVMNFSADDPKQATHDGVVVTSTNTMLVMTDENGMQSSHEVTGATRVTRDGVGCQAKDLNSGTRIRVTTADARQGAAIAINAMEKDANAASE